MDQLKKCLTQDGEAVVIAVDATELLRETIERTDAWPPAMLHLGQAMMASLLLQSLPDRNDDERLELQWRADGGPFGSLFAECRGGAYVRGAVFNPRADVSNLTTPLGPGVLQVRRLKARNLMPVSTGIIESRGEVLPDLLDYLEKSEQKVCAMSLWVDIAWNSEAEGGNGMPFVIRHAYGFLVHVLPQSSEALTNQALFKWDRHLESLGPISKWVLGPDPTADILSFVSAEFQPKVISHRHPELFCTCSEERAERALALLSHAEEADVARGMSAEELAKVRCEFCGRTYLIKDPVPSGAAES